MSTQKKSPFLIEDPAEDSGFLMLQASNLWSYYQAKALRRFYGLSHMQFNVLASVAWQVLHNGKEITQVEIAHHIKSEPTAVSQMIRALEDKGYISRTTNSTNIRAKSVELTEEGKDLMIKVMQTIYDVNAKFFSILGKNIKRFNGDLSELINANDF